MADSACGVDIEDRLEEAHNHRGEQALAVAEVVARRGMVVGAGGLGDGAVGHGVDALLRTEVLGGVHGVRA